MAEGLDIPLFLEQSAKFPVVDVRTPAEFLQGHIPGAHNIPLFSDEERKQVGTTYNRKGHRDAVIEGLGYAGPKMKALAEEAENIAVDGKLLVHCWRGGMRSASMAWLFRTAGIDSIVLNGGYKSYRRHLLSALDREFRFIVIGGLTGSGKTDVLYQLVQMGEQVLDLENLAHHKGSAFGSLGQAAQNSNEQFENDIFSVCNRLDTDRIIWVEDESRNIGRNTLPSGIYKGIRNSPLAFLDVPMDDRLSRLLRDYTGFPAEKLNESIEKIRPRLGDKDARSAMEGIRGGNFRQAIELVLRYYDKTYTFGLNKRGPEKVFRMEINETQSMEERARMILEFVRQKRIFA